MILSITEEIYPPSSPYGFSLFRGCHSESPFSILTYSLYLLLCHQPPACPLSRHPYISSLAYIFTSLSLPAPSPPLLLVAYLFHWSPFRSHTRTVLLRLTFIPLLSSVNLHLSRFSKMLKKTKMVTVIGSIRLLCWLSWDDSRSTGVKRCWQGQQALSSFLLETQGQISLQQGQFQLSFWGEKCTRDGFMLLNTSCNVSSNLYATVPDLGRLHLKHFSLLLKFCTPHCYMGGQRPSVKGGTSVATTQ